MKIINKLVMILLISLISGCQGVTGQAGYQPPVLPLKVTIDTSGKIGFDLETDIEYPTPLGTFSVGIVVDPIEYFNRSSTLTIRLNCEDNFYDLHGKNFSVELESGYYEKINLTKRGDDILLDLRRIGSTSVNCPAVSNNQANTNSSSESENNSSATQTANTAKSSIKAEGVQLLTNKDLFWDICEEYTNGCEVADNITYTISNNWNNNASVRFDRCYEEINGSAQMPWNIAKKLSPGDSFTAYCFLDNGPENYKVHITVEYGNYEYGCWYLYPYTKKIEDCDN